MPLPRPRSVTPRRVSRISNRRPRAQARIVGLQRDDEPLPRWCGLCPSPSISTHRWFTPRGPCLDRSLVTPVVTPRTHRWFTASAGTHRRFTAMPVFSGSPAAGGTHRWFTPPPATGASRGTGRIDGLPVRSARIVGLHLYDRSQGGAHRWFTVPQQRIVGLRRTHRWFTPIALWIAHASLVSTGADSVDKPVRQARSARIVGLPIAVHFPRMARIVGLRAHASLVYTKREFPQVRVRKSRAPYS